METPLNVSAAGSAMKGCPSFYLVTSVAADLKNNVYRLSTFPQPLKGAWLLKMFYSCESFLL